MKGEIIIKEGKKINPKKKPKKKLEPPEKSKVSQLGSPVGSRKFSLLSRFWELILFSVYVIGLLAWVLPKERYGYDVGHDSALLMSSWRIWLGQVPYRDFYSWYGPLYHYFFSFFVGLLGNNLYATKIFIDLISPILSMVLLIFTLRNLGLAVSARAFILIATPILGLERIYYCGSLRNFLPVFLLSLWYRASQKPQKLIYFSMFPSGLVLYFFSPEVGLYTLITALFFLVLSLLYPKARAEKMEMTLWSAAGLILSVLVFGILYLSTSWVKNYLEFVSVLSSTIFWSHGLSRPSFSQTPQALAYFIQPLIHLVAVGYLLGYWLRKRTNPPNSFLILVLTVLGLLLTFRSIAKAHPTHIQFSFLPALIISSLVWAPPFKPIKGWKLSAQVLLVLIVIYGGKFFKMKLLPEFKGEGYQTIMGVRVPPEEGKIFQTISEFYGEAHNTGEIVFPIKGLYYAYLGLVPEQPFDDLHYVFHPNFRNLLLGSFEKKKPKYLILNEKDLFWDYVGESVDPILDYIDTHYQPLRISRPVWIYQRLEQPREITELVKEEPGPIFLRKESQFRTKFLIPEEEEVHYIEFSTEFNYPLDFLSQFSMPIIECKFDGRKWVWARQEEGRQRVNPMKGKHYFRVYLYYLLEELELEVKFPGIFNFKPREIKIENIQYRKFIIPQLTPRSRAYGLEEPPLQ